MNDKTRSRLPIIIIILILIGTIVWYVLFAQSTVGGEVPPPSASPEDAAEQGLTTFPKLITEENFATMGFASVEEVTEAQLGKPLEVFYVPLDQLKAYQPETDIESLLVPSDRVIFPVIVKTQVRSSLTVSGSETTWRTTEYGAPMLIKALETVRTDSDEFVVTVPALNLYFLARRSDKEVLLTPIVDDAQFDFVAGATLSATEVFERILPAAREHEDLPTGG